MKKITISIILVIILIVRFSSTSDLLDDIIIS